MAHPLAQEEERLRAAVRHDAAGLRQAVDTLQAAARKRIGKYSIGHRPFTWLAGALMLGWMMGSRIR